MAVWKMSINATCAKDLEVIADTEDEAKERAFELFQSAWKAWCVEDHFELLDMDVWEATNENKV